MWPLKTIFFFVVFWIACAGALINPIWGVLNYVMVYQVNPQTTWWGIPLADLGLRFSLIAALSTLLGLFLGRKRVPEVWPPVSLWESGLVLMVVIGGIGLATGYGYNAQSAYAFEKLWKMLLFVLILGRLATTRANLKLLLSGFVVGSLYLGYDAYTAPPSSFWLGRLEMIGGPDFSTTSGTAAHLSAMLPLIGVALLIAGSWKWRATCVLSGVLCVNGIILCRTRSAFVGLVCGVATAVLTVPRVRLYRVHALLILAAICAFGLTDNHFWTRMGTLTDSAALADDAAAVSRSEIWLISLKIISDHPGGLGPGNFSNVIGTYSPRHDRRSTHNTLLACFAELGLHGGALFLLLVIGALRYLHLVRRMADRSDDPLETRMLAYGFLVAFVTYFVTGLGTERFYCESYWWIMALPMCLYRVVAREVAARAEEPLLIHRADGNAVPTHWPSLGTVSYEL